MAFQLIYTSAARLLDSPLSGYGIVARSEGLPGGLARRLVELSVFKTPADQGIVGPQCSYRVEEYAGQHFHILTVVRSAGADYSSRICHLAHHLILRDDEVRALLSSRLTTPAGIILALEMQQFWLQRWEQEPAFTNDSAIPPLTECPPADNFPTWSIFSGDPNLATSLYRNTVAKDNELVILVPTGTRSHDILRLLHESSVLSPLHGWGIGFCTYSTELDPLPVASYLFSTPKSALHSRAIVVNRSVLDIHPGMQPLPPEPAPAPTPEPIPAMPQLPQQEAAAPTAPVSELLPTRKYSYAEAQDSDIFSTPWRVQPKKEFPLKTWVIWAMALVGCICLLSLLWPSRTPKKPAPPIAQPAAETPRPILPTAEEFPTSTESTEPDTPAEPTVPEPIPLPPPATDEPELPTEPTPAEQPATPAPEPAAEPAAPAPPAAAKKTLALVEGDPLPAILRDMLPGHERLLSLGEYIVHIGSRTGNFGTRYALPLQSEGARMVLRRADNEEFIIFPLTAAADAPPVVRLQTDGSKLLQILVYETDTAAVQLPIPDEEGRLVHILLVPQISVHLAPVSGRQAKPAAELGLRVQPGMLKFEDGKLLPDRSAIDKSILVQPCELHTEGMVDMALPMLTLPAKVAVQQETRPTYTCTLRRVGSGVYDCSVARLFLPWNGMRKAFSDFVNEPCCGVPLAEKAPAQCNVAQLYRILTGLENEKRSAERLRSLVEQYALLYRHRVFGEQLRGFFRAHPSLTLNAKAAARITPKNATSLTGELYTALQGAKERHTLVSTLCEVFSMVLERAYNEQCKKFADTEPDTLYLRLISVTVGAKEHVVYTFRLIHP